MSPSQTVPAALSASDEAERRLWLTALALVVFVTIVRLFVIFASSLTLAPEEAQYWSWSRYLAFGYYSKPPMIAWLIAGATNVCGDGEACIRSSAPLIYAVASLLLFEAARLLYDARTAFWSALVFIVLPGVSLSSSLITTDVPLFLFWSAALVVLGQMLRRQPVEARGLALALGALIGLAMLSKYAGAYFLMGLAFGAMVDTRLRAHVLGRNGVLILAAALAVFSPNVVWNAQNGFVTVWHTAGNAAIGARGLFNPDRLAEFLANQFALFGPVLLAIVIAGLVYARRPGRWPYVSPNDRVLLASGLPIIAVGCIIALLSKANGNWSAAAYVSLTPLAVAWVLRAKAWRWLLGASMAISVTIAALMYAGALIPRLPDAVGLGDPFKVLRGWDTQARSIVRAAREGGFDAILADDRREMAILLYYTRRDGIPILMWTPDPAHPENQYELTKPYEGAPGRVLLATTRTDATAVTGRFSIAQESEIVSVSVARERTRVFRLIELDGFKGR